ncbi:uncharacterized protein LOC121265770 [Juglans microcarpa x Juglans regia]|uniref:uncharacterized protein LOC121265770 n=1 Tax=Juglans microcarpa x Juglans regia TaxID=2249226 RepID=UPI001B7F4716|nr:uncharacterized protein LOC121265770 [Juglans microcarpa x Juglans regia]
MTVRQYAARFGELSCFAAYLDEEKKARKFLEELLHKAMLVEQNLKRGVELQEQRKRATPQGFFSMDHGPWKKRNEVSSSSQRQIQGNHTTNPYKFYNRVHVGECRKEVGSCFRCRKDGHVIRERPLLAENNRKPNPTQSFRPNNQGNNQRRTVPDYLYFYLYGLYDRKHKKYSPFLNKAIVLFDSRATHSFISMDYVNFCPIEAKKMDYNLMVSTPAGDTVTWNKNLFKCPITISRSEMPANLIVFPMIRFDVILGMDWLASSYTSINCFKKEVVFKFSEGEELRFMGSRVHTFPSVISTFQVCELIRDGCQGYLAYVVDEPKQELELEEIPTVREYP